MARSTQLSRVLVRHGARPGGDGPRPADALVVDASIADGTARLAGHPPSARVPRLAAALPDLTGGEGIMVTRFDHSRR